MKQFFKITLFKIILTLVIIILPFVGTIVYNRSIVISEEEMKIEANFAVKGLYCISNAILFPIRLINIPLWKLFLENYYRNNTGFICPGFLNMSWFISIIFFLIPLIIEAYLLSCIISYLTTKIQKLKREKPDIN